MKTRYMLLFIACICLFAATPIWADTLEMKDGQLIEGKYMGGTQHSIRFNTGKKVVVYSVQDILAITFSSTVSSTTPSSSQRVSPVPKASPSKPKPLGNLITSGSRLSVVMLDTIDVTTAKKDDWFTGVLNKDVIVNGNVVAPKDSKVYGQVIRVEQGRSSSSLAIELRELVVKQRVIPITTKPYVVQAKSENVIDMSSLKIVARPRTVQIPYRTLIEFELTKPIKLNLPK